MELLLLGLLAFAGYKAFQYSVQAGSEAIRAYVYLEILNDNQAESTANAYADLVIDNSSSNANREIIKRAKLSFRELHGGKQLPVIGYAYRKGLRPNMPFWYRAIVLSAPTPISVEVAYGSLQSLVHPGSEQETHAEQELETNERFKAYYKLYTDEVFRLSGKEGGKVNILDLMEKEPLYRAYRDGIDPLVLAAVFCQTNNLTTEKYESYETYYDAFAKELSRFANDATELENWLKQVDHTRINSSYQRSIHPRLAADGYRSHIKGHDNMSSPSQSAHKIHSNQYGSYSDYHAAFLAILKPCFTKDADVERMVNTLFDNQIRNAYEREVNPVVVAEHYRSFLGDTLLSTKLRVRRPLRVPK